MCLISLHFLSPFGFRQVKPSSSILTAQLVSIPHAESLLHADCEGEEVNCEISPYSSQWAVQGPCHTSWFMATLRLSSGISIVLVLRGPHCGSQEEAEEHDATLHPKLRIPMSKEGTLLTTGDQVAQGTPTALRDMRGGDPASPPSPYLSPGPEGCQDLLFREKRVMHIAPPMPPLKVSHAPAPEDDKHLQDHDMHLVSTSLPAPLNPLGWLPPALQSAWPLGHHIECLCLLLLLLQVWSSLPALPPPLPTRGSLL